MVKVSAGASRIFVENFASHTAKNLEVSDAELTIARVRETLGSKLISKDKQVAAAESFDSGACSRVTNCLDHRRVE